MAQFGSLFIFRLEKMSSVNVGKIENLYLFCQMTNIIRNITEGSKLIAIPGRYLDIKF